MPFSAVTVYVTGLEKFFAVPLVGDTVYGRKKPALPIERHFLHAARLTLRLPSTGEERTFTAPLPDDLARVLKLCLTLP